MKDICWCTTHRSLILLALSTWEIHVTWILRYKPYVLLQNSRQLSMRKLTVILNLFYSTLLTIDVILPRRSSPTGIPTQLKQLFGGMTHTTEAVTPSSFLSDLRRAFPQFAEMSRATGAMKAFGGAYAQQGNPCQVIGLMLSCLPSIYCVDAEECWSQILQALKEIPGLPGPSSSGSSSKSFIEQYVGGEMRRE